MRGVDQICLQGADNNPNVSPEMREKVMNTIKEQGYQVNMLARGLKGNRTNIIVVFAERHHEETSEYMA